MATFHMPDSYYETNEPETFICSRCDREYDVHDREPDLPICHGCYRFPLFCIDLHRARDRRRAHQSAIAAECTVATVQFEVRLAQKGDAMFVDAGTLDLILAELSPHVTGEVVDVLGKLGLLPDTHRDRDHVFVFIDEPDPPPSAAAAPRTLVLAVA
jgi:hypothetical protein